MASHVDDNCLFCKIIAGKIPSFKLVETTKSYSFLDIGPLSKGHVLVIPKSKKIAQAVGASDYNILQNNGSIAHQVVMHVHVHFIPKPNEEEGLVIGWPTKEADKDELKKYAEGLKEKLSKL